MINEVLRLTLYGMAGIFGVLGLIMLGVVILNATTKKMAELEAQKQQSDE